MSARDTEASEAAAQLKQLTAVEHQLEIVVIDHLRELERRRLYLPLGCSSLFDYATRELGGAVAERLRPAGAQAVRRRARRAGQRPAGRGAQRGSAPGIGALPRSSGAPAQTGERAEEPQAAPVLDSSAWQALVEQAAGKSTRQVEKLLAGVDPELTAPADRIRPLGAGRWELKAAIDDDCRQGLEQLKGLLSHVDPHLTLGQLVGRVVREAVERHDPARPPRGRRTGGRAATRDANETSAPKDAAGPSAEAAQRTAIPAGVTTSAAKAHASSPKDADCEHALLRQPSGPAQRPVPSAPKGAPGRMALWPAAQLRQRRRRRTPSTAASRRSGPYRPSFGAEGKPQRANSEHLAY